MPDSKLKPPAGMVLRDTDVLTLGQLGVEFLWPERIRLQLDEHVKVDPIDIGAICFARRERLSGGHHKKIVGRSDYVDPQSLREERRELIRQLLDKFFAESYRDFSIYSDWLKTHSAVCWCDKNECSDFLSSPAAARDAYRKYVDYLHHCILVTETIQPNTAGAMQRAFVLLLKMYFGADAPDIVRSIPGIPRKHRSIEAPEQSDVSTHTRVCLVLALQLSDVLIKGSPFPFQLDFNDYATFVFPRLNRNVKTPYAARPNFAYNFDAGRIATAEEHFSLSKGTRKLASARAVSDAEAILIQCNNDLRHVYRMQYASLAMQAYAALFIMITGANPTPFINFEYDEALERVRSPYKKELTSIKFRSGGKTNRYPIGGKQGLALLKKYLDFRRWMVGGEDCKWLFFRLVSKEKVTNNLVKLHHGFQSTMFSSRLRGTYLPESAKNISPGLARKYKSLILHELKISPSLVAGVIGHTQATNILAYAEPTRDKQKQEFGNYWASVRKAAENIKLVDVTVESTDASTVVGHCENMGNPEPTFDNPPVKPNCQTQYGCLFCTHYVCHADDIDVHKLLSLKYVMQEVRAQASDLTHADNLLKDLCIRIDVILEEISSKSATHEELVARLKNQVFSLGVLTPFWENRLNRYEAMGVVL